MPTIYEAAREVARALKRKAKEADEALLKTVDPRAVQGGAVSEEAQSWRRLADEAYRLAGRIQDYED
jgi:hypothetical protein